MKRAGAAGGTRGRRRLRWITGVTVALVALLVADPGGVLSSAALGRAGAPVQAVSRTTEAATPRVRLGSGDAWLASLGTRLRLEPAAPPVDAAAGDLAGATASGPPDDALALGAPSRPAGDLAITAAPATFDPASRPPPPPLQLAPSRYDAATATGGTWALIIGVNDYPGLRYDLRSAVNDANDVDEALAFLGVTNDRRLVLRDQQADAPTIRAALDWLTAHAGPGSTIVLFFAGHVQRLERGREALVGSDGGIVPDTEVAAMLDRSPAERAWITIAGCFGGGFDEVVRPGRILTAAAPSDRVAYENEGFGRSYLVEYMVRRAILGHGISTVEGAFAWASAELQRDYPDRLPVQLDAVGGDFDLRSGAAPPPPSSGSSSPPPPPPPSSEPPKDSCSALTVGVVRCS